MNIIKKPTQNFTVGREGYSPIGIVLHIMQGTLSGTDSWFASKESGVSSHYGIGSNGEVHQYVKEEDQAWCVGLPNKPTWSLYDSVVNPNKVTINIEHEGDMNTVWSEAMKNSSAQLISDISKRWNIPLTRQHVIGHYEINSVTRPNCPAVNKGIIDEVLARAIKLTNPVGDKKAEALALVDKLKAILQSW